MSNENVEIVRRLVEAFGGGHEAVPGALLDPEVEVVEWPEAPDRKTFRGHEGWAEAMKSWGEAWASYDVEIEELVEAGDKVLGCIRTRAVGKGSGVEVEIPGFNVFTVRDGKVVRVQFFLSKEPALEAAGITESGVKQ